jgi:cell division septum initiation protein DivIVA
MTDNGPAEGHPGDDERRRPEGLTGVLDALEQVIGQARAMPMSSSVLVNRAEVVDLLAQARAILPGQLARADEVLADADTVLARGQREAEEVVAAARERAAELVGEEEVVRAAHRRAEEILAEAERTAAGLRRDADDYCDRRLADFEIDLGKVLAQVQAGRAKLAGRLEHDLGGDEV